MIAELTERERKEIVLAVFYDTALDHGTAGHNRLKLIAKLAKGSSDDTIKGLVKVGREAAHVMSEWVI